MGKGSKLIAIIGDEDTVTGFVLAGIGELSQNNQSNFLVVEKHTSTATIESTFIDFTKRNDIGIILICQHIAEMIRTTVDSYVDVIPTVLEIPSKEHPYDPEKDYIMKRMKKTLRIHEKAYVIHRQFENLLSRYKVWSKESLSEPAETRNLRANKGVSTARKTLNVDVPYLQVQSQKVVSTSLSILDKKSVNEMVNRFHRFLASSKDLLNHQDDMSNLSMVRLYHPVLFTLIDKNVIIAATRKTGSFRGLSGLNALV
ncbi:hypothetical protein GJ496_003582 [Pomphorhynchus laevis]|nr:hypothetical protein GJ496_003582 [Pomphorhynchus laevis]